MSTFKGLMAIALLLLVGVLPYLSAVVGWGTHPSAWPPGVRALCLIAQVCTLVYVVKIIDEA